ncbi:MAG: methyltransferase domain-containing protein [Magnetococcales bacterium]|nr:methyltransferase domain-containing protein [Magnetococcales bacterium]
MTTLSRKHQIATAFAAAETYHTRAEVQRQVAIRLADHLHTLTLPPTPRILELGCGSGFLSQHLLDFWPTSHILLTDITHPMIMRNRAELKKKSGHYHHVVMDGEYPAVNTGWDLITSSMTLQWFDNLPIALHHLATLLNPGGWIACSTLGRDTFHEWRQTCDHFNMPCGTPLYPTSDQLQALWPPTGQGKVTEESIRANYPNPMAFLQDLKTLGTHRAARDYQPATAGHMRRLLRSKNSPPGFSVTYHVLHGFFQKRN